MKLPIMQFSPVSCHLISLRRHLSSLRTEAKETSVELTRFIPTSGQPSGLLNNIGRFSNVSAIAFMIFRIIYQM
jgi:hypothetical protein